MTTQARRTPRTEEPGRLQSLGWQSIRAHTRQGKGTVAGLVGREPDGGAQTSSKDTWVGGGVKAEDRKGGGRMDEGGVSPSQVKQGSQREAGVEGPVERGLTQPEGTQLPWREGGGTWTGAHRLVGAGAADEGSALSLQRQGGGGDEGGRTGAGGGGVLSRETEAQPAQAHGTVGLETTKAKWQSPGTRNSTMHFWVCSRQPHKGDATFQSARRGSGLELGPGHFTHSCFTHSGACVGPSRA